ncbi:MULTISPECIES: LuxR C-terminal-related transcriptional regulator [unclassified Myroides]|uniref:LuxR C-terminal-related transcriptional regulator n=1 Tax=unclassified Myroides TaxID=2642485 RepID=UPI003D2F9949
MQQFSPSLYQNLRLVLVLFFISLSLKAQNTVQTSVQHLTFRPHPTQANLMIASDSFDNTWIKGTLKPGDLNTDITFQIQNPHIYDYELYVYQKDSLQTLTPNIDTKNNPIRSRFTQYSFNTAASTYYVNLKQIDTTNLPIVIEEQTQFAVAESFHLLRIGLYYGIAIMSIVFNLVFYFIFQDKRFMTYTLLQISIFTSLFFEDGMFYYLSNGQWEMSMLLIWNVPLTSFLACLFTVYFLDIKQLFQSYKLIFISLFIAILFLSTIQSFLALTTLKHVINILCFLPPFFCLILAATQFKKNVYARFLLCTFGLILLFGVGYFLYIYFNSNQFAWFNLDTFRLISNIELISITFAIIYKVRDLQDENNGYKEQINHYLMLLNKNADMPSKANYRPLLETLENLRITHNLTTRETEVLQCIWENMSNQEIADKLFISLSTTKYHISNLYTKLEIKNRNQALLFKKKK